MTTLRTYTPAAEQRPYRVLMCDREEPDIRFEVRIEAAFGPADARRQAKERYPSASPLQEREA